MNRVSIQEKEEEVREKRNAQRGKKIVEKGWAWNTQEETREGERAWRSTKRRKEGGMREPQAKRCRTQI